MRRSTKFLHCLGHIRCGSYPRRFPFRHLQTTTKPNKESDWGLQPPTPHQEPRFVETGWPTEGAEDYRPGGFHPVRLDDKFKDGRCRGLSGNLAMAPIPLSGLALTSSKLVQDLAILIVTDILQNCAICGPQDYYSPNRPKQRIKNLRFVRF